MKHSPSPVYAKTHTKTQTQRIDLAIWANEKKKIGFLSITYFEISTLRNYKYISPKYCLHEMFAFASQYCLSCLPAKIKLNKEHLGQMMW